MLQSDQERTILHIYKNLRTLLWTKKRKIKTYLRQLLFLSYAEGKNKIRITWEEFTKCITNGKTNMQKANSFRTRQTVGKSAKKCAISCKCKCDLCREL